MTRAMRRSNSRLRTGQGQTSCRADPSSSARHVPLPAKNARRGKGTTVQGHHKRCSVFGIATVHVRHAADIHGAEFAAHCMHEDGDGVTTGHGNRGATKRCDLSSRCQNSTKFLNYGVKYTASTRKIGKTSRTK
ncbi:hypothetical protein H310_11794 [Aphanomyces invadans]|uniref:Uncharacterized protein n=1 Tax=Aphanomyces invadans TaxID=157072 RepID=A0A024TK02_9STRA|nr:hypothetical protein H310_11794 [Aphanomyces invadans]ETV94470.1 hypothetical protein H310_11794 [Aphanomyces invadans]|eukprot:XP_008876785.1 hypothetical protein H310_11794 [Aphanomyces invadans]